MKNSKLIIAIAAIALIAGVVVARFVHVDNATPPTAQNHNAMPTEMVGFSLPDTDGKMHDINEWRGKIVVLNFWATWCPPCRREMPSMQRMWQKVKGKGVQVLAINVGEDADTIFEFLGSYPVSFPLLMDRDGSVVKQFPVTGLPTTYIVDPRGKVVYRAVGSREWDDPKLYGQLLQLRKQ